MNDHLKVIEITSRTRLIFRLYCILRRKKFGRINYSKVNNGSLLVIVNNGPVSSKRKILRRYFYEGSFLAISLGNPWGGSYHVTTYTRVTKYTIRF